MGPEIEKVGQGCNTQPVHRRRRSEGRLLEGTSPQRWSGEHGCLWEYQRGFKIRNPVELEEKGVGTVTAYGKNLMLAWLQENQVRYSLNLPNPPTQPAAGERKN